MLKARRKASKHRTAPGRGQARAQPLAGKANGSADQRKCSTAGSRKAQRHAQRRGWSFSWRAKTPRASLSKPGQRLHARAVDVAVVPRLARVQRLGGFPARPRHPGPSQLRTLRPATRSHRDDRVSPHARHDGPGLRAVGTGQRVKQTSARTASGRVPHQRTIGVTLAAAPARHSATAPPSTDSRVAGGRQAAPRRSSAAQSISAGLRPVADPQARPSPPSGLPTRAPCSRKSRC